MKLLEFIETNRRDVDCYDTEVLMYVTAISDYALNATEDIELALKTIYQKVDIADGAGYEGDGDVHVAWSEFFNINKDRMPELGSLVGETICKVEQFIEILVNATCGAVDDGFDSAFKQWAESCIATQEKEYAILTMLPSQMCSTKIENTIESECNETTYTNSEEHKRAESKTESELRSTGESHHFSEEKEMIAELMNMTKALSEGIDKMNQGIEKMSRSLDEIAESSKQTTAYLKEIGTDIDFIDELAIATIESNAEN